MRRERLSGISPLARASKRSKPEEVAKVFADVDHDGDGLLSLEELDNYFGNYLGYGRAEIKRIFEQYGRDGKGVDLESFQKGFASLNPYLVSNRKAEVIIRKPGSVCAPGGQVSLEDLTDCTVLVCDRSEQVFMDMCKGCNILIGPCDSSTFVRDCEGCTFWVVTRQLRTRDCKDCKFFLHSHTEPIIESSKDLAFAPFSASYPGLTRHFEEAKLDAGNNFWSAIFDFTPGTAGSNWRILALEECQNLLVELPGEPLGLGPDSPAPALSYELLVASPPTSSDCGQSVTTSPIPQRRPENPPAPSAGTSPQQLSISDGGTVVAVAADQKQMKLAGGQVTRPLPSQASIKLRKPKWMTVNRIKPEVSGVNVFVKVVQAASGEGSDSVNNFVVGDATGVVTLRARGAKQIADCQSPKILRIQNARAVMVKGHIQLEITKWGVLKVADDHEDIEPKVSHDVSAVEYELKNM